MTKCGERTILNTEIFEKDGERCENAAEEVSVAERSAGGGR